MILNNEINYRSFYPQTDLYFKFEISDYSSRNFEVGLSGEGSFFFSFNSGFIKSPDSKIVGSFYKEPVIIDGYIKRTVGYSELNYYLNGAPIDRNIPIEGLFRLHTVAVKIKDINETPNIVKYIDLSCDVLGSTIPEFEFEDFKIATIGLSGKIKLANNVFYPTRIFNLSSQSVSGQWVFPNILTPNIVYSFYNKDIKNLAGGTSVVLNLDTDAGLQSYDLTTTIDTDTGGVINVPDPIILENQFARLSPYSGEIIENQASEKIYQLDFAIGANHRINFNFDYYTGKYGDAIITKNLEDGIPITLSGNITPNSEGKYNGFLFNSDFSKNIEYVSDVNSSIYPSQGTINFSIEDEISGYFTDLKAIGTVTTTEPFRNFKVDLLDSTIFNNNFSGYFDIGGLKGKPSNSNSENRYVPLSNETIVLTAIVGENDNGGYSFNFVTHTTGDATFESKKSFNIADLTVSPYRGVAFAALSKNTIVLDENNNNIWSLIEENTPALLYKDIRNITKSTSVALNDEISGFILNNNHYTLSEAFFTSPSTQEGKDLCNTLIERSITYYNSLNSLSFQDDAKVMKLSVLDQDVEEISLDETNFFIHPYKNINNKKLRNLIYKTTDTFFPHVCYSFDDPIFLYSRVHNKIDPDSTNTSYRNIIPNLVQTKTEYPKPIRDDTDFFTTNSLLKVDPSCRLSSFEKSTQSVQIEGNGIFQIPFKTTEDSQEVHLSFSSTAINSDVWLQISLSNNSYHYYNEQNNTYEDISQYVNLKIRMNPAATANFDTLTENDYAFHFLSKPMYVNFVEGGVAPGTQGDPGRIQVTTISGRGKKKWKFVVGDIVRFQQLEQCSNNFSTSTTYYVFEVHIDGIVLSTNPSETDRSYIVPVKETCMAGVRELVVDRKFKLNIAYSSLVYAAAIGGDFTKYAIKFKINSLEKNHSLMFRFVEGKDSLLLSGPETGEISIKNIGVYIPDGTASLYSNTNADPGDFLSFKAIFNYFICKLHKIAGAFGRENYGLKTNQKKTRVIFTPSTDESFISPYFTDTADDNAAKVKFLIYKILGGADSSWSDNIYTNEGPFEENFKVVFSPTHIFANYISYQDIINDNIDPFFSIATDFVNLYAKDTAGGIVKYASTATPTGLDGVEYAHKDAVDTILAIIKNYNPECSKRYIVKDGELLEIPRQLNANLLQIDDSYSNKFKFNLPIGTTLNIPYAKARYYEDSFFYETPTAIGLSSNDRKFPEKKENLNTSNVKRILDYETEQTIDLKRILYFHSDDIEKTITTYTDLAGRTISLPNGYFEKVKLTDPNFVVTVTGLLPYVKKRTAKVWDVELADDENMSINKIDIINEKTLKVYNRNGIRFVDYDSSIYSLDGISLLNDNQSHTKFLKVKYLNPPEKIIDASDTISISLTVLSGISNEIVSTENINIP